MNVVVNAVRAFFTLVLGREVAALARGVPRCKRATTRAEVYATTEVGALIQAPARHRDRAFLAVVYACGLRLDEAIHLRTGDIDAARGQLHVRHGKATSRGCCP